MKKSLIAIITTVTLIPLLTFAWVGPTSIPPRNNTPSPINIGSTAQYKQGTMGAYEFCLYTQSGEKIPPCLGKTSGLQFNGFPWVYDSFNNIINGNDSSKIYIKSTTGPQPTLTEKFTVDGGIKASKFCIGASCITSWDGAGGGTGDVKAGLQQASYFTKWGTGSDKTINKSQTLSEDTLGRLCLGSTPNRYCITDWTGVLGVAGSAGTAGIPGISGSNGKILTCATAGQVVKWDGSVWKCGTDNSGTGGIGSVLAGSGITVGTDGRTVSVSSSGCSSGYVLKWNGSAWACAVDSAGVTGVKTNGGLTVSTGNLSLQTCPAGQILKAGATAGTWTCAADATGTSGITSVVAGAGGGITVTSGNTVSLQSCTNGKILKSNGTSWSCQDDVSGSGGVTNPVAGTANSMVKFTGASTIGNSNLTDDGTYITNAPGKPIRASGGLIIETRTTNPTSPTTGMIWLCTDTGPNFCDGI